MIVSASRRTDIPACYSEWFFNRIREGHVVVRNPMRHDQLFRISLSAGVVDGIVFWTKNPAPMLDRLRELEGYSYYFQFTLNGHGQDIEKGLPSKRDFLLPVFRRLSNLIGRERVLWRYDPILLNETYTFAYHKRCFRFLAEQLASATEQCTVSFLDFYRGIRRGMESAGVYEPSDCVKEELLSDFSEIAKENGITLAVCAEELKADIDGVRSAHCIDQERLERICGVPLKLGRDKNQRSRCGCAESIDIGAYNTCHHGCLYCYANHRPILRPERVDPFSPILGNPLREGDIITDKELSSCKNLQQGIALF